MRTSFSTPCSALRALRGFSGPGTASLAAFAVAATGCVVAPCPENVECSRDRSTGGAGTAGVAGGGGADGDGAASSGGRPDGPDGSRGGTAGRDAGPEPSGEWTVATGDLKGLDSECGNLQYLGAKPERDLLIAGVAQQGLRASPNGGSTWSPLGTGAGSAVITNRPTSIVYDPADPKRYWESGLYNVGGVYRTTDDGATFTLLLETESVDLVSVDFTNPDRKTILAGSHERSQLLHRSKDGGKTWEPAGAALPPDTNCTFPLVLGPSTYLVGCGGYGGGVVGIFRSDDGAASWVQVSSGGGGGAPVRAADGAIYWVTAGGGGMVRSTNLGRTFTEIVGPNVLRSVPPAELPDGRIAALGAARIVVSADGGDTWQDATTDVPIDVVHGILYSPQQKAFYAWHFTCDPDANPVPADAVIRYAFE